MEEVFLYGCEICQNVVYVYGDYGKMHVHMCKSCNGGTFHKKIVIMTGYDIYGIVRSTFALEEKKDDIKGDSK